MSGRTGEHFRRALPPGSSVRRQLDYSAGEGTSRQSSGEPIPRVAIVSTPRKHEHAIRNIRRNVRGLRDNEIDDYLRELEAVELRRQTEPRDDSDMEDISPAEDSGDEYRPPGEEREHESELEFSGFSAYDEEDDESFIEDSESDGESEGDGPVPRSVGRPRRKRRGEGRL